MIGVVVVTHGQLATELVNAAETIVGDLPQFAAVSIGWHDDVEDAREDIAQAIERVQGPEASCSSPTCSAARPPTSALTFLEADRVEVITGVNLPMLIKLASLADVAATCWPSRARCASTAGTPSGWRPTCCGPRRRDSRAVVGSW